MEDYLCHYGVLGMKWGRRKNRQKSSNTSVKRRNNNRKETSKVNKAPKKKRVKDLSNEELQNKIRRLQMEKQYRDLKRDEVSAGKKLVGEILKTSGKTLGVQVANYLGGKAINKAFNDEVIQVGKKKKDKKNDKAD